MAGFVGNFLPKTYDHHLMALGGRYWPLRHIQGGVMVLVKMRALYLSEQMSSYFYDLYYGGLSHKDGMDTGHIFKLCVVWNFEINFKDMILMWGQNFEMMQQILNWA